VAAFEAAKGMLVVVAGLGLAGALHRHGLAELLVGRLHLNPAKRHARIFLELLADFSSGRLWFLAALATIYAIARLIEAYGLWRNRAWAKWFAALSGGIYIPFEVYELFVGPGWIKIAALLINLAIVAYMLYSLR
jgi:uncharacterized membrane protein (DUF2068 family)